MLGNTQTDDDDDDEREKLEWMTNTQMDDVGT